MNHVSIDIMRLKALVEASPFYDNLDVLEFDTSTEHGVIRAAAAVLARIQADASRYASGQALRLDTSRPSPVVLAAPGPSGGLKVVAKPVTGPQRPGGEAIGPNLRAAIRVAMAPEADLKF